jgi:hypothetical protein
MLIPTAPPTGRLEFLPYDTIAATATRLPRGQLELSVWVPGFDMDLDEGSKCSSEEGFIDEHCEGCDYYFEDYDLDSSELGRLGVDRLDDWAGAVISATVESSCPCWKEGLDCVSFPCRAGLSAPSDHAEGGSFNGPPMCFSLTLNMAPPSSRAGLGIVSSVDSTKAWSQAAYVKREDPEPAELCLSSSDRSLNIHPGGEVCWGCNDNPVDLASMVEVYAGTTFNEDLMGYSEFHSVRKTMNSNMQGLALGKGCFAKARRREFVDGRHAAMLVVHPTSHSKAHPLLLAMGAKPQGDGLIVLPLMWHDTRAESTLISPPLGCGVSVLVRPDVGNTGIVVGQAPCSNTISPSPAPSPQLAHA